MAVTQKELADKLQVSQMTISRALRGSELVKPETRDRILHEARTLGYSLDTNFEARSLRKRRDGDSHRTNVFCAIVHEADRADGFGGRLWRGIVDGADEMGNEVVVTMPRSGQVLPAIVSRQQVDGVIWMVGDIQVVNQTAHCPVPWISLMYEVDEADCVGIDDRLGGMKLGRHLAKLGHRCVGFVGPETELAHARIAGLREGLAEAGGQLPKALTKTERFAMGGSGAARLVEHLFEEAARQPQQMTAIAVYNDYMAAGVIAMLRDKGMSVPDDISVTGFDGSLPAGYHGPTITTAAIPLEDLGVEASRMLAWRIGNPNSTRRNTRLDTELIVGQSTREVSCG